MRTKTSFISQVLECPLIILASHHSLPSVYFLRVCTSTPPKHTHAAHYCVLQALSLSGFTSPFSFSSFGARTHTETRTNTQTLPTDCFPIFFFLAERFMVGGMLETGYYHVPFELISQTKWPRWCRRHPRAFSPASPMPPFSALSPVLTPSAVAPHSPTLPR